MGRRTPSLSRSQAWHECSGRATKPLELTSRINSLQNDEPVSPRQMFAKVVGFAASRTSDLFKQLESRDLTEDENTIIQQRVR